MSFGAYSEVTYTLLQDYSGLTRGFFAFWRCSPPPAPPPPGLWGCPPGLGELPPRLLPLYSRVTPGLLRPNSPFTPRQLRPSSAAAPALLQPYFTAPQPLLTHYSSVTQLLLLGYSDTTQLGGAAPPPPNPGLLVEVLTLSLLSSYFEVPQFFIRSQSLLQGYSWGPYPELTQPLH